MSEPGVQSSLKGLYIRFLAVLCMVVIASVLGYTLGMRSVPVEEPQASAQPTGPAPSSASQDKQAPAPAVPLYFFTSIPSEAARAAVSKEIAMAAAAGIHQYAVSVPLPWDGDMKAFMEPLNFVVASDPQASLLIHVLLDAPPAWLAAHPDAAVTSPGASVPSVSLASEEWLGDAGTALNALVSAVNTALTPQRVQGFIIGCLESGAWNRGAAVDASVANQNGFRRWLKARYVDDAQLQKAWGDAAVTLETAPVPDLSGMQGACTTFVELPAMQRVSDFLRYTSESTATIILKFCGQIKQIAGKNTRVIATYGYSFDLPEPVAGHFALGRLLDSADVDGFASPVSYVDRGLGGAGGFMGAIDTAALYGKQWYIIDDTRTGIARDPSTGEIARPRNVRPEDIYSVQQRNFAAALAHKAGLLWSDAEGEGRLHDENMWNRFGSMAAMYADFAQWEKAAAVGSETAPAGEGTEENAPPQGLSVTLAVVVDEESRFVQACGKGLNELLLTQVRDSAARAGLPVKYYLLRDVISGKAPGAAVYLFLNAFKLSADDRVRLHSVLEQNKANAIWMYAPGYFGDDGPNVENITQITGIQVKAFDGPAKTGSVYTLAGKWLNKDDAFGLSMEVNPLFYIEDDNADMLAKYAVSGKASIATRFFEEGWGSVLCAEPSLTPAMLREILGILEVFLCYQPGVQNFYDTFFFGDGLVAIHGKESGERTLELDQPANIQDLLAPEVGWQHRRVVTMPLKTGDTRMLKIMPVAEP